jgi:hypothetical protein
LNFGGGELHDQNITGIVPNEAHGIPQGERIVKAGARAGGDPAHKSGVVGSSKSDYL